MELNNQVELLMKEWEAFKGNNDRRIAEIEKKGSADPILIAQNEKLNAKLDELELQIKQANMAASRPAFEVQSKGVIATPEYKKAFEQYVRSGLTDSLKAMSVNVDANGGYLVTPEMSQIFITKIFETSPIRQIASVQTISTDSLDIIVDNDEAGSGWVAETAARTATDTATIGKKNIPTHEQYVDSNATQKLIDDAAVDVEAWIAEKIADKLARTENTAFVVGDGVGKPRGFTTYAAGTSWGQIEQVVSGSNGAITGNGLIALLYAVKGGYRASPTDCAFVMQRNSIKAVRQLKETSTDNYLWQPGLQAGQPATLLGYQIAEADDMPAIAADSLSVAFGNFRLGYQIVDRLGVSLLRDPYSNKPYIKFYATKRVGGDVANFEAIKLLKLSSS